MLKKIMIRIAKVAVLASLIVSTVVMSGCKIDVKVVYDGHWDGPVCVPSGDQCEVTIEAEMG